MVLIASYYRQLFADTKIKKIRRRFVIPKGRRPGLTKLVLIL